MVNTICCTRCGSSMLDRDEDDDLKCIICGQYMTFMGHTEPQRGELERIRNKRRYKFKMLEHGTHSSYINNGCRCAACKEARSEYQRENRIKLRARLDEQLQSIEAV